MKKIKLIALIFTALACFLLSFAVNAGTASTTAKYVYDANNRLTKVIYSNVASDRTINFTYDNNGNLTNVAADGGSMGVTLKNGTAVTAISGLMGAEKLYTFDVASGQTLLEIKVSGGTGDCDLEVSNSNGTVKKYSLNSGNTETIRICDPPKDTWTVKLICRTDVSGLSLVAKTYTGAPLAPAGLKATDGTFADKIVLTWTEAAGASSYLVYRDDKTKSIAEVEDTIYTDTDAALVNTKTYTYFVKSKRSSTESVLFSTGDAGFITKIPPAPTTIAATDGTYFDKIRVTWSAVPGATSYDLIRYEDPILDTGKTLFADLTGLTYDDGTCDLNKTYYYAVITKINNVPSVDSKRNAGILSSKGPATITATSGTLFNKIRVTWVAVPGATSYNVYVDAIAPVNTASTSTTYEDAQANTNLHTYKVTAQYLTNESLPSSVVTGKAGAAPATLTPPVLKSVSTDLYAFVRLTWGEVGLADKYFIYRSTGTEFAKATWIKTVDVPTLTYDDITANAGTKYNYWVTAVNAASTTPGSKPSTMMSGRAAAALTAPLTSGTPVTGIIDTIGKAQYYSIVVPAGTTRLVATLTGTTNALTKDCDLYLKAGCYPTTTSFNVKGTESASGETAIVTNPVADTWYILLYAVTDYSGVTLKVDCYSAADIILTQVPVNNQTVPFAASFKGRVVDEVGTGIPGMNIKVRDPISGQVTTLTTKTDATGYFTYSTTVGLEGEHTYDFYFADFPDLAKGTASHTVSTRIGASAGYAVFDSSSYLPATPVALANLTDTTGMQTFLNIRNGWDPTGTIDLTYEDMWVNSTVIKTPNDDAIANKGTDGLFIAFYGVEGAGAGNDTTANSALSTVPLLLHITPDTPTNNNLTTILNNLGTGAGNLGVISDSKKTEILAGGVGIVAVTVLKDPTEGATPVNLSLLANDELSLISDFISNTNIVGGPVTKDYSGVTTSIFTILLNGATRNINIVTVAY